MKGYLKLLQKILDKGCEKESGRANMPPTWGIEFGKIKMDMSRGFPLLTTKQMFWKGIVHELLWFLRGDTNIKYLVDNGVNIWNGDAYRWFKKLNKDAYGADSEMSMEQFIKEVKRGTVIDNPDMKYTFGDLGKVYGEQWRNQNGVDQIKEVFESLTTNPWSRYHIIDGWNKADFPDMALPPCHLLYQFIVRPLSAEDRWDLMQDPDLKWNEPLGMKNDSDEEIHRVCDEHNIPKFYLNLNMYQRSCDTFLGVPFNIASMSLLLMIFAKAVNMIPGTARWLGGDVHLYTDHIPVVKEQLTRAPKYLPQMIIKKDLNSLEDILGLTIEDFELEHYESFGKLKGELFTGNKKQEKRVFKINIEKIPDEDIEGYVKSVAEKFKKNELPIPEEPDLEMDIEYMTEKRDIALERFNKYINELKEDEAIQNALGSLMRVTTQLRMMEDARTIYNKTNKK